MTKMQILKKAVSQDGHTMFMYEENGLYAMMFDRLPCVNPSTKAFTDMMWARHMKIYGMKEVPVKADEKLPQRKATGATVLARAPRARFLKPKKI